jgi:hypothetical protein
MALKEAREMSGLSRYQFTKLTDAGMSITDITDSIHGS